VVALAQVLVVLGACLVGDGGGHGTHALDVERRRQRDRLREDGGDSGARDAVQALAPPVVGGDAEAGDGGRLVQHLRRLLGQRQAGEEIVEACRDREIRIEKGERGRHGDSVTVAIDCGGMSNEPAPSSGPSGA
jgi:hypothetical protein